MRIAEEEYSRLILEGLGIFRIAEAWGIAPLFIGSEKAHRADIVRSELPEGLQGRGVLTEPYVLEQMALQILEFSDKVKCYACGETKAPAIVEQGKALCGKCRVRQMHRVQQAALAPGQRMGHPGGRHVHLSHDEMYKYE